MKSLRGLAAAVVATLSIAGAARAQTTTQSFQFNIGAGAAFPTGSLGDAADVGYNLAVGVGTKQRLSVLGFRLEGMYNEFGLTNSNAKAHAGGLIGNATIDLSNTTVSTTGANTFYLIGGIGYYNTSWSDRFSNNSQSNIGYNIGGGFRFPLSGFSAYLEARYHGISNVDMRFVPVVFGLVF